METHELINKVFHAFIPLFVAMDGLGTLPIFVSLTQGISVQDRKKVIGQSMITAFILAFGFIVLGKIIFHFLGITIGDFMLAGGVILFCIAIIDIVQPSKERRLSLEGIGAVPIGTPLIVGPGVLTTSLILVDHYGIIPTLISVFLNLCLVGIIFFQSDVLIKILGKSGSSALSKVMALLLAAIAVMLIRQGLVQLISISV